MITYTVTADNKTIYSNYMNIILLHIYALQIIY